MSIRSTSTGRRKRPTQIPAATQIQILFFHSAGYSEDSDYTSDLNYPVGHNANSSASQYRNLQTPQRSLEASRENSYDKEDRTYNSYYDSGTTVGSSLLPKAAPYDAVRYNYVLSRSVKFKVTLISFKTCASTLDDHTYGSKEESDPLFYNSRPLNSGYNQATNIGSNRYRTQCSYSGER